MFFSYENYVVKIVFCSAPCKFLDWLRHYTLLTMVFGW